MGHVRSMRRTGRGLSALRDRYIRRADFLCLSDQFQDSVAALKTRWESSWPGISPSDLKSPTDETLRHQLRTRLGSDWSSRIRGADGQWADAIEDLILLYFPPENFHFATDAMSQYTPAKFLDACLKSGDPRTLIGQVDQFFPPMRIQLEMDLSDYDAIDIKPEEWELYLPSQRWYIPVYPGMTAEDLKAAIPEILNQINLYLAPQTVGARIEELARNGLTHRRIAETLGLDEKSVSAHLRSARAA